MLGEFVRASEIVPEGLDATTWESLGPLYAELIGRQIDDASDLERLILDRSEVDSASKEAGVVLYISMTCRTDDREVGAAYERHAREVQPLLKQAGFQLDTKIATSQFAGELDQGRYGVYLRDIRVGVQIFRSENLPIETSLTMLAQEYAEVTGAMTVRFRGQELALPRMARFQEDTDRSVREEAWRLVAERRLREAERLDGLFERMLEQRNRCAANAGCSGFSEYLFLSRRRHDYTPDDCHRFARAVEKVVAPAAERLIERRKRALGVASVRPWDVHVDVLGRGPLRPFVTGEELVERTRRVFRRMDPGLGAMFDALADATGSGGMGCLDIESRKGKAPGGYQEGRERMRLPFIFMNAAGVARDVETMVHEAGHAFHSLLTRNEPLLAYRSEIPLEFAEVASMCMELFCHPFLDEFYSPVEADRARRAHLEQSLVGLSWIASVDQFQHWIYSTPGHTRAERHEKWFELLNRYAPGQEYAGLEEFGRTGWHRVLHIFEVPFYYIEYGIAWLGALQLWGRYRTDPAGAIRVYKEALALGGSRPLPELFRAAGLRFEFGEDILRTLVAEVEGVLAGMPE